MYIKTKIVLLYVCICVSILRTTQHWMWVWGSMSPSSVFLLYFLCVFVYLFVCLYLCCNNDGHPALDVSVGEHGGPRHVWSFHVPINASRSALWLHCHSSPLLNTHWSSPFFTSVFLFVSSAICVFVYFCFFETNLLCLYRLLSPIIVHSVWVQGRRLCSA